ncbi:MAG: type II toxin-antitoxin system HicB family antitoxin [Candidatus Latescibacter sp.]|nr:type II toxin-antitoxin system HicB family antitoxin [Candidatus Latescibacter sp.]
MKYTVIIETSTSGYGAYVPDIPGCIAAGSTREEVLELIKEAIEFHIQGLKDKGHIIPPPTSVSELVEVTTA